MGPRAVLALVLCLCQSGATSTSDPPGSLVPDGDSSVPVANPVLVDTAAGVLRAGEQCWDECSQTQGPCEYCGTGLCCRLGYADKSAGCTGGVGTRTDMHTCAKAPQSSIAGARRQAWLESTPHLFYINLAERTDRDTELMQEMVNVQYPADKIHRVDAIRKPNGAVGCGMSHIKALNKIKEMDLDQAVVIEDDFQWQQDADNVNRILNKIFADPKFSICLFTCGPGVDENGDTEFVWDLEDGREYMRGVEGCQTTTGYIIRRNYVDTLIANFQDTINLPSNDPNDTNAWTAKDNHIDQGWKLLQRKDSGMWMATKPYLGWQRAGMSDIEQRDVQYFAPTWHDHPEAE